MITKKAGKPAVKAAAKPVAKAGAKALQKKPIDLKSPEKPAAKPAAKPAPAATPAPAAAAPRGPAAPAAKPSPAPRPAPSPAPAKFKRQTNGAVKVGVVGCAGRMGQMLLKMLINAPGIVVVGGTERRGSIALGQDHRRPGRGRPARHLGRRRPLAAVRAARTWWWISPTRPRRCSHAQMAARTGCALVIGTTGFDNDQLNSLYRAAQRAPIVLAANMSLGINLLQQVVEEIARILDTDWDIEIVEMHHRAKIDAPSGTALALGEAAARGRGQQLRRISRRGARRPGRAAGQGRDRLRRPARRRRGRRPHRHLRGRRRAGGDHPPRRQPRDLRARRGQVGAVGGGQEARALLDARCARLQRPGAAAVRRRRPAPRARLQPARAARGRSGSAPARPARSSSAFRRRGKSPSRGPSAAPGSC